MTELTKPITRRTTLLLDHRALARTRDKIAITIYPDQTIGFRPYRARREVRVPLTVVYKLAVIEQDKQDKAERQRTRELRRRRLA